MSAATTVIDAAQKAQNFANQTVETARFEALKEPLGFIKILQFLLALLAFSIAVNGSSTAYFSVNCVPPSVPPATVPPSYGAVMYQASFGYSYNVKNSPITPYTTTCNSGATAPVLDRTTISSDSSNIVSSAEFFVFTGVTAFLYSLFMGVVYVFFRHKYSNIIYFPLIDFAVTCLFTIFWFAGSIAWAKAIGDIQSYTNPDNIVASLSVCTQNPSNCQSSTSPTYANIIVSCIFGFGNLILWAGDVWFVMKETSWYKAKKELERSQQNMTNNPISTSDINITASYNPNNKI